MDKFFEKLHTFAPHASVEDMEWLEGHLYDFNYGSLIYIDDLRTPFLKYFDDNSIENFVYDKRTGYILMDFSPGHHAIYMGSLYGFYRNVVKRKTPVEELDISSYGQDDYLDEHMGFFLSSTSDKIHISEKYIYTPQERQVFRGFKLLEI